MYQYIDGDYVHGPDIYLDDCYMDERWWYIDGAPGYMISDKGRVWSIKSQQFVKPKPMDRKGHLGVCLSVDGEPRYYYVHRLMAKAFIPNPDNYPIVRHLNDVKYDNSLENLAWGTKRDNALDAIRNGISYMPTKEDIEKCCEARRRPIKAIDLETGKELIFRGQNEASRILRIHQANIWKVLNGQRASTCGYYFEYLDGDEHE